MTLQPAGALLAALADPRRPQIEGSRIMVVVAHPDDETIGVGAQLPRMPGVTVLHVTDGAPRNLADAQRLGFSTAADYAAARRRELEAAMAIAGVPATALLGLGLPDQGASFDMAETARRLAELLVARRIELVLTHPYEGGHPDHDATSFIVWAAGRLAAAGGRNAPGIVEMAFYHAGPEGRAAQRFPADAAAAETVVRLEGAVLEQKQRMLDAHQTQAGVLAEFRAPVERYRIAPAYDYARAPNGGRLHYEAFDWGMTGERWRALARAAAAELALAEAA